MSRSLGMALASIVSIGSFGAAMAADMAVKAPPPPPLPVYSWTGFYAGVNAGGVFQDNGFSSTGTPGPCSAALGGCTAVPNYSTLMAIGATFGGGGNNFGNGNFIGGGQIGYNWQRDRWVFGLEADIQGIAGGSNNGVTVTIVTPSTAFPAFPLTTRATATEQLDYFGTVRGRAGWLASPSFLLYGTGGLAYGEVRQTGIISQSIAPPDPSNPGVGVGTNTSTRVGYTVGGGAEWAASSAWSFKVEGLYYDLGRASYLLSPAAVISTAIPGAVTGSATARFSNRIDGAIFRVGVNYHFNTPVLAKY